MFFVVYSFGMLHDGENNDCPADSDLIMDAVLSGGSGLYMWSSCSADFLSTFLRYFLCITCVVYPLQKNIIMSVHSNCMIYSLRDIYVI